MKLLKRLSNTLTRKRKEWTCLHYWVKGLIVDGGWPVGLKFEYTCARCDKSIERWNNNIPINESTNPLYDKKCLKYNMSPPIIRSKNDF